MSDALPSSDSPPSQAGRYDSLPYDSYAFPQSHPGRLAAVAALFGMEPCSLDRARVLEVGCAGGGNLVPVAAAYRGSEFLGLDISPVQIARAREFAAGTGLKNIRFLCQGLESLTEEEAGGKFDYIIAHGVYSWVEAPVREALLDLCGRLLNPRGIAYISYNVLPGSTTRTTLRDALRFHARTADRKSGEAETTDRISRARELCALLGEALEEREDGYSHLMMTELTQIAAMEDFYLAHEHLEDTNDACYFHEFMDRARLRGLQYLGDAETQTMATGDLPQAVRQKVRALSGDLEEAEQFHDFIRNRSFRQTLLCRSDVELKRGVPQEQVHRFHFASLLSPENGDPEARRWTDEAGSGMEITDTIARAALAELRAAWPACLDFWTLLERAARRCGTAADGRSAARLSLALLTCHSLTKGMEFHLYPPVFSLEVPAYPRAWEVALWQAPRQNWVTSVRHENVALGAEQRVFLHGLDGTRSARELESAFNGQGRAVLEQLARMGVLAT